MLRAAPVGLACTLSLALAWASGCAPSGALDAGADASADAGQQVEDAGDDAATSSCEQPQQIPDLRVHLPEDEQAHQEPFEWWYWTGHLQDPQGRWYGFEQVVFLVNYLGMWGQTAHHAITDIADQSFHHMDTAVTGRPAAIEGGYRFSLPPLTAEGGQGHDSLHGAVDGYVMDLELDARKPVVFQHGNGYTDYDFGGYTYYYSRERMAASGTLQVGAKTYQVAGTAWFDHQWGPLVDAIDLGWDWFALQLEGEREIMLFTLRAAEQPTLLGGSFVGPDCQQQALHDEEVEVTPLGEWTSPHSGCTYPSGWELRVRDLHLRVVPVLEDQELRTQTQTYWEGAAVVEGDAAGRAYIELTGYCG